MPSPDQCLRRRACHNMRQDGTFAVSSGRVTASAKQALNPLKPKAFSTCTDGDSDAIKSSIEINEKRYASLCGAGKDSGAASQTCQPICSHVHRLPRRLLILDMHIVRTPPSNCNKLRRRARAIMGSAAFESWRKVPSWCERSRAK